MNENWFKNWIIHGLVEILRYEFVNICLWWFDYLNAVAALTQRHLSDFPVCPSVYFPGFHLSARARWKTLPLMWLTFSERSSSKPTTVYFQTENSGLKFQFLVSFIRNPSSVFTIIIRKYGFFRETRTWWYCWKCVCWRFLKPNITWTFHKRFYFFYVKGMQTKITFFIQ